MVAKKESQTILSPPYDSGIVELSLMLSRGQFEALEERARYEDLSVAQFLRRLVHESISEDVAIG